MPLEEFQSLISNSTTYTEVLEYWGFSPRGGNFRTIKARIEIEKINDTHLSNVSRGVKSGWKRAIPLEECLVENSTYNNGPSLKQKLFAAGLKTNICEECGQGPIWNNKPLTLQLDHINGNRTDNRIENLRILCPHCHTQTPTFAGRNLVVDPPSLRVPNNMHKGKTYSRKQVAYFKSITGKEVISRHKVPHPTAEELKILVWSKPLTQLAKDLGVSDSAIHKWCRQLGVEKPPKGYFQVGVPVKKSA